MAVIGLRVPDQLSGVAVDWIPVLHMGSGGYWYGLLADGSWVGGFPEKSLGLHDLSLNPGSSLLRCLEIPLEEFRKNLKAALDATGEFPPSVSETFPFSRVIDTGLASGSDYWFGLALHWLEVLRAEEVSLIGFQPALDAAQARKGLSQKNRQHAFILSKLITRRQLRGQPEADSS